MKQLLTLIVALGALGTVAYFAQVGTTMEVDNVQEVNTPLKLEPEYPSEWLEEAEKAKIAVLERKQDEVRLSELEEQIEVLDAERVALAKKLGSY